MIIRPLIVILGLCLVSCEDVEDPMIGVDLGGISGLWQGIMKNVSSGSEQVMDVSLDLRADQTFLMTKLKTNSEAVGTYDEFSQLKSLTLRVKESEFDELGLAGGIMDFEYEHLEGELLLSSRDRIVRLKRPDASDIGGSNEVWRCSQEDLVWQLSFASGRFVLYLANDDGASVFLIGSMNLAKPEAEEDEEETVQGLSLLVEDGQPLRIYEQLDGFVTTTETGDKEISLTPMGPEGQSFEPLICKQEASLIGSR